MVESTAKTAQLANLTPELIEDATQAFMTFDADGKGTITSF